MLLERIDALALPQQFLLPFLFFGFVACRTFLFSDDRQNVVLDILVLVELFLELEEELFVNLVSS